MVEEIPSDLRGYISVSVVPNIQNILRDPRIVGDVYRAFEKDPPAERTEAQYTAMIRRDVIGEKLGIHWDGSVQILTLSFTAAEALLQETVDKMSMDLATMVTDTVQRLAGRPDETTMEDAITYLDRTGSSAVFAFRDAQQSMQRLRRLQENAGALYTVSGGPIVYADTEGTGRSTTVIIATITAFFLTVFLALVLEYVRRVRQDTEEMEKLREAWKRT